MNLITRAFYLFIGLCFFASSYGQHNWFPEGDYRHYGSLPLNEIEPFYPVLISCGFERDSAASGQILHNSPRYTKGIFTSTFSYMKDTSFDSWPLQLEVPDTGQFFWMQPMSYKILKDPQLGDSWFFKLDTIDLRPYWIDYVVSDSYLYDSIYKDSLYTISFNVRNKRNEPAYFHPLYNKEIVTLGKSLGVIRMPVYSAYGNRAHSQLPKQWHLFYSEKASFGSKPPRNTRDIFDYQVGSEFHTSQVLSHSQTNDYQEREIRDVIHKVLSVNTTDSIIQRVDSIYFQEYRKRYHYPSFPDPHWEERLIDTFGYAIDTFNINLNQFNYLNTIRHDALRHDFESDSSNRYYHLYPLSYHHYYLETKRMTRNLFVAQKPYEYFVSQGDDENYYFVGRYGGPYGGDKDLIFLKDNDASVIMGRRLYRNEILSTAKVNAITVKLYPNPASSQIHLSGLHGSFQYQVSNIRGQLVLKGELCETDLTINTSELNDGVYFLQLRSCEQVHQAKFIVGH